MPNSPDLDLPLAGVRVLELGGGLAAAVAGRWLAGYGADVARTEGPADSLSIDECTALLPGKRRIAAAPARLRELALAADIVLDDAKPGALAARGLDPQALCAAKPSLVLTQISAYGQTGPYAEFESSALTAHASGGIHSLTGLAGRPPLQNGGQQAWVLAGLHAFSASVTAYLGAQLHGEGDRLDISAQECAAGMLELYGPRSAYEGGAALRLGNRVHAIWGLYPCADGYAGVCALQRQVDGLFRVIGDPELQQPRFTDPAERAKDDRELGEIVGRFFAGRSKAELLELGAKHRVPIGAVLTPLDLLANESLVERGFFDEVASPEGAARVPGRPFLGLGWRAGALSAPAADTEAVHADWLGGAR